MKRRILAMAVGFTILTACGAGEIPELLEPVSISVQTTTVQRGEIYDMTVLSGTVIPKTVPCGFSAEGRVAEVLVNRGDTVKAGDVLALLDTEPLKDQLSIVETEIQALTEDQAFADRRYELEESALTQSDASDAQAQIALLENAHDQEESMRNTRAEELEGERTRLEQSIASAALVAPCDGTVLDVKIRPGDAVYGNEDAMYLADESSLRVITDYTDDRSVEDAAMIYATIGGVRYEIEHLPYDHDTYIALRLANAELQSTFLLENPVGAESGMYTLVYVVAAYAEDACWLPANAVFRDADGAYVYRLDGEQQTRIDITTGIETAAQVQILSGLQEGDVVYVS